MHCNWLAVQWQQFQAVFMRNVTSGFWLLEDSHVIGFFFPQKYLEIVAESESAIGTGVGAATRLTSWTIHTRRSIGL